MEHCGDLELTISLPVHCRDAGATEQQVVVERLALPVLSLRTRAAQLLDVMEIQYVAQLQSDDDPARIVDSSAQRSAPGNKLTTTFMHLRPPQLLNIANHLSFAGQDPLPRVSTTFWASRMDRLGSSLKAGT